jgi:hypothetical protein
VKLGLELPDRELANDLCDANSDKATDRCWLIGVLFGFDICEVSLEQGQDLSGHFLLDLPDGIWVAIVHLCVSLHSDYIEVIFIIRFSRLVIAFRSILFICVFLLLLCFACKLLEKRRELILRLVTLGCVNHSQVSTDSLSFLCQHIHCVIDKYLVALGKSFKHLAKALCDGLLDFLVLFDGSQLHALS